MKTKFKFLIKDSIKKKINTKSFKIINICLFIIIIALINLDSVVKFFGGDFDKLTNIYVIDEVGIYDEFKTTMDNSYLDVLENYNAQIKSTTENIDELKEKIIKDKSSDIIINISNVKNKTYKNMFDVELISYDYIDAVLYQNIANALNTTKANQALSKAGISQELLNDVYKNVEVKRTLLNENLNENEELMEQIGGVITIIFIVPFFILILLIVQMIGAEINEEKSTKSMEIIISSVKPEIHFMSKLISANVFALIQGLLLIFDALVGVVIRFITTSGNIATTIGSSVPTGSINTYINMFLKSDIASKLLNGIPFFIVLILLSIFAYSLFIGILASVTTNMEDYNQIQTPIMIFLMIGYYLAIYASIYEGSTFIKVMSFIPFISGILSPVVYIIGDLTIFDLCISIGLLLATCAFLYKYGLRVYKSGILNYSSKNLWKKMFKSLKNK